MALQQVRSFRTSDNTLHAERKPALIHESKLSIRGFIQSHAGAMGGNASLTPTQVANLIQDHMEEFYTLIGKSRDKIRRCKL